MRGRSVPVALGAGKPFWLGSPFPSASAFLYSSMRRLFSSEIWTGFLLPSGGSAGFGLAVLLVGLLEGLGAGALSLHPMKLLANASTSKNVKKRERNITGLPQTEKSPVRLT